ncbi:hypothetical protein GCM10014719_70590 [Planomonospora parontospora subsp. antibiotica]|nr:hypothetical protein GCM10014719_70590 [Planomonospora parontospora subsp. antibiotica]GII20276.1 hypothetical protein Ppa05_70020 [Planomonospora parontospora subsp. antibiotica]
MRLPNGREDVQLRSLGVKLSYCESSRMHGDPKIHSKGSQQGQGLT